MGIRRVLAVRPPSSAHERRTAALLLISIGAVFLLPQTGHGLSLVTATGAASIVICALAWLCVRPDDIDDEAALRSLALVSLLGLGAVLVRTIVRYDTPLSAMLRSAAPAVAVLIAGGASGAALVRLRRGRRGIAAAAAIALLLLLLVALKWQPAEASLAGVLVRAGVPITGPDRVLPWLGVSYITFRLVGSLLEFRNGRLPSMSLYEFVAYVLFAPTLVAGPIDRAENFLRDLRAPFRSDGAPFGLGLSTTDVVEAGRRITLGALKTFVVAEALTTVMLQPTFAEILPAGWSSWLPLYAFTAHLYFDFSGYSDLAVGCARLLGIRAPENFRRPFLAPNLTEFWNRWHMSLTQWIRAYWFNPLARALRRRSVDGPAAVLLAQLSTMLLIGLWHGVSANFALWGLWHGCGLFVHNRWSEFARRRLPIPESRPRLQAAARAVGAVLTFHYFALSMVFFVMETPQAAATFLAKLFGFA